jgi:peptidoglycan/LPS O-acetylase OafA/YrhL
MVERLLISLDGDTRENNNFDFIRLSMASLVWSHSFALYFGTEDREPLSRLLHGDYNSGNIGVMVFFIISGFLVTRSFIATKSVKRYMEKRIRRIYPGYLVATSICAFVVIPLYSSISDLSALEVAKTVGANLILRRQFPPSSAFTTNPFGGEIYGSLWSIPFEFWCYIGVVLLGVMLLLKPRRFLIALTVVVIFGRVVLDLLDKKPVGGVIGLVIGWPYVWFVILPIFLLGMLANCYQQVLPRSRALLFILAAIVVGASRLSPHLTHIVAAPALAYATFYVAFSRSISVHRAAACGDFSYGTYLYAFPIQQMLFASWGDALNFAGYFALSLGLSLLAGVGSWHLVEKWFVRRLASAGLRHASVQTI